MTKTILITGSTDGIGKILALQLAKEGHRVLIHGRSQNKIDVVISEITKSTGNPEVYGYIGDFSDMNSVREMSKAVLNKESKIDILINNAGIFTSNTRMTDEGIELRFAVNFFSPVLLTNELMPLIENGEDKRIINLSSAAQSGIHDDVITGKQAVSLNESYAQSKLALTMWNNYMGDKHPDMVFIAVNPGSLLNTKMANEAYGQHWSPAEKGSNILYELAMSNKHKSMSGKYFDNDGGSYSNAHPHAYDKLKIEALMEKTIRIIRQTEL